MPTLEAKTVLSIFLPVVLILGVSTAGLAASDQKPQDPNAAVRKTALSDPLATLKEVEKVQRTNSQLAIQHFTGLIQKDPKDALSYARRGKAYSGLKDYEKATADLDKAISLDPKLPDAYVGRAVVRYVKKDYDGSWQDVHQAESLGGQFWPSFMEALKASSKREK